jgi:hypothetical protein
MYYSQSFLDDPLAFSLRVEFDDPSGPAGLIRLLARDFGDNTIATANDPWNIILAIKEHYPSAKAIFDAASEISIFIDDSGSMRVSHVEATIARMRADAISSGYTVAASTSNAYEEIICPFAQSQCCSSDAQALMDACGVDVDCGATSLSFIQSPDNGLIREYCDNNSRFPTDGEYFDVCNTCITPAEENEDQTIEYTALAANSQGQNADHVEIRYTLESSDNGTDWTTIENLDNGFSGTQQELNVLIDNWGGSSIDPYDCHQWLSGGGEWGQLGSDIDGEAVGDFSGYSVSLNAAGDRVAIGAPYNDGNGAQSGHTRIFEWNGNNWTQLGGDIDGEAAFDESGYSVSLNAAGDRVAIGAIWNAVNGLYSGHTRIFEWSGSSWTQLGSDIDGEAGVDQSGYSVSLNSAGDRVAIGAPGNDGNDDRSGHTRIFEWNVNSWVQLGGDIDGEAALDQSGYSVSLNSAGDRVAIGAPYNDGNGAPSGHTRIFEWSGSSWTQLGGDIDGEAGGDLSGFKVSLNSAGDRVAIGATYNDGNGDRSGHTRIFEWNGNNWTQLGGDIDGEAAFDESGYSVSLNAAGDRVATGAPSNDNDDGGPNDQTNSGHTRIFEWSGSSWTQLGSDIDGEAALDVSGYSVSLNAAGDRVATGAPSNDSNGYQSGHTRIFDIDTTNDGTGACFLYQDTTVGSCKTRIWTRQFRIKAETIGYPLSAYSNSFKLYEWRNQEFII